MARSGNKRKSTKASEMMTSVNLEQQGLINGKSKFRYLTARSDSFEKQISELLQALSGYVHKSARCRDSGDVVAEKLNQISLAEMLNPSLKKSTSEMAKSFRDVQDYRDTEILYLEEKLLPSISMFGQSIRKQKDEVKVEANKLFEGNKDQRSWIGKSNNSSSATMDRRRSKSVERTNQNRVNKNERALQQTIQKHELSRNLILKKILMKFINSEMRFMVQSINKLTEVYRSLVDDLNPYDDLEVFGEFFNFRKLKKTTLVEVESSISGINCGDLFDESGNESSHESGLEEDDSDDGFDDNTRRSANTEEDSETSRSESISIQSTLRRFNSTPEINQENVIKSKPTKENDIFVSSKTIKNKLALKMKSNQNETETKIRPNRKQNYSDSDDLSEDDNDDDGNDNTETVMKPQNGKSFNRNRS